MRIAFDHQCFTFQRYGGVSTVMLALAEALAEQPGVTVDLHRWLHVSAYPRPAKVGVPNGFDLRLPPKLACARAMQAGDRMLMHWSGQSRRADVLHASYYQPVNACGRPVVVTVHDCMHERYPEWYPDWREESARKRAAIRSADRVVCISETTRRDVLRWHPVDPDKLDVVPLGRRCRPDPEMIDLDSGPEPVALYIGERGRYKNFMLAARGVAGLRRDHPEWRLVAFGGGPLSASEASDLSQLLGSDGFEWLGGSDAVLQSQLRRASCLLAPSRYEGFGLPLLDAMEWGVPVITSGGGSQREVGADAVLYADPDDPEAWSEQLHNLLQADVRRRYIKAGRERAQRFSWQTAARAHIDVYRRCVSGAA